MSDINTDCNGTLYPLKFTLIDLINNIFCLEGATLSERIEGTGVCSVTPNQVFRTGSWTSQSASQGWLTTSKSKWIYEKGLLTWQNISEKVFVIFSTSEPIAFTFSVSNWSSFCCNCKLFTPSTTGACQELLIWKLQPNLAPDHNVKVFFDKEPKLFLLQNDKRS